MVDPKNAVIVIPTYNEALNVERLVKEIRRHVPEISILFVDDNSPDGTADIIKELQKEDERIFLLERQRKEGLGRAYIAGFRVALEKGFDYIFEMDADFSHDPKELLNFLKEMQQHDLVIGSRYIKGVNVINWPLKRLLLSYFANLYTRIITGVPIADCTGGYKCFRKEVLQAIDFDRIKSNGYAFQIELNVKAWEKGFKIKEIPIIF
ncbi:MAG TPA: polyprenol monophosphomannose synthase, partial [Caldithrix abyssi]|nr:polyprenol monophosphomannose synthase [Caldithrix abyssi]